ncbi:GDSL-type esterase/lipase family protein [Cellulomonas fengjieae]|uniref:Lipase n=1 Tax=Cellulomonas fengjieae TaxID=2819978 RepID=A0ABS3SBU4_9CELL|nr:GDSL-type esterase/lipase family protein [Cellulomonas fengjieae]MBO3083215.1 lipase [Cellulomonas fengjieae]QVI65428.1 lipase [Cellulomonas fengjieae]
MRIDLPDPRVEVRGAAWLEETPDGLLPHRLPAWTRAQFPDAFMAMVEAQPSGVRLRFRTAARTIRLDVRVLRVAVDPQPPGAAQPYDVLVDDRPVPQAAAVCSQSGVIALEPVAGTTRERPGPPGVVDLVLGADGTAERDVEVWLPPGETTRLLALTADAPVVAPRPVDAPRWVHHGSSISHGAGAGSALGSWPVVAARSAGLDLVNLGLSGNAVLDPFIARAIRDQPADVISLKLGINVVNHDAMRLRAFVPAVHGFLDTVREGHPTTPLLVVSPLLCPLVETTPGPTSLDPADPTVFRTTGEPSEGALSLTVIRSALRAVVTARQDAALHYVDGTALYGPSDADRLPMRDLMHPDAPAHRLIGTRFAAVLDDLDVPVLSGRRARSRHRRA